MSFFENILYGFTAGLTEFLPVSRYGHQALLRYLFGVSAGLTLQDLLIHIGILLSVFWGCREYIARLRWEQKTAAANRRRKSRRMDSKGYYDLRLLRSAVVPMLIAIIIIKSFVKVEGNLLILLWLFVANGLVLLLAEHARQGNRESASMSGFDGTLMGVSTAPSIIPGLSGTGLTLSYASARGVDIQKAINWVILLVVPTAVFAIGSDAFSIFSNGFGVISVGMVAGSVLAGIAAFCGGYAGIAILRLLATNLTVFQFSYYSFGLALLTFLLYLFT